MTTPVFDLSPLRILGLMTGSSADGLDLCLVEFSGAGVNPDYKITFSTELPYPKEFQTAFRNPLVLTDSQISALDHKLGLWFATEIAELDLEFDVIASHGQTIKHEPPTFTLQIGKPSFMAEEFNVPVIYDFRTADINHGGQGAPLIPVVDRYLFQQDNEDILALNIGGIANLTIVPARNKVLPILAWDTGPGNTLIDKAIQVYSKGKLSYDPNGTIAKKGKLNHKLLKYLLAHEFYDLTPPRSAGQEQFGLDYFSLMMKNFYPTNDQQFKDIIFTLTVLSAKTIADSVKQLPQTYQPHTILIGGGGYFNTTLIEELTLELPDFRIKPVNLKGVNESNKEAFGFAYLGYLRIKKLPGNIPSVTGASRELVLGNIYSSGDLSPR